MITAGVTLSRDPDDDEAPLNAGVYRYLVKEKNLTGIDIVTPNNLHRYAARAYEKGEALLLASDSLYGSFHLCDLINNIEDFIARLFCGKTLIRKE